MSDLSITPTGGSVSIGGAVTSGTDNALLFIDPAGTLAEDPTRLNYDKATKLLTLDGDFVLSSTIGGSGFGMASFQTQTSFSNPYYGLVYDKSTTNLIPNPVFTNNVTDGWSLGASTARTRDTTNVVIGPAGMRVQISPAAANTGVTTSSMSVTAGQYYFFSMWAKSTAASETITIFFDFNSGTDVTATASLTSDFRRVTISTGAPVQVPVGASSVTIRIGSGASVETKDFYISGVQFENVPDASAKATTFCCGDMGPGYAWTGTSNNSSSTRAAGFHILAQQTSNTNSATGFAFRTNGGLIGSFGMLNDDESNAPINGSTGSGSYHSSSWTYVSNYPTNNQVTLQNNLLVGGFKVVNKANGTALIVDSAATTDIGLVLAVNSITSGTALSIAVNTDKTNFSGEYFKFTAKSATDTSDWRWSKIRHQIGIQNENLNKYISWYGGGKFSTTNTSKAGTISQALTTVTGVGTAFTTDFRVGDIFVPASGSSTVITAIASNTSMTVETSQTIAAGTAYSTAAKQYSPPIFFLERPESDHRLKRVASKIDSLFIDEFGNLQVNSTAPTAGTSTITTTAGSSAFTTAANDANIAAGDWIHANGNNPLQVLSYSGTSGVFRGTATASLAASAYRVVDSGTIAYPTSATDSNNKPYSKEFFKNPTALTFTSSTTEKSIFTDAAPSSTASALPILQGGQMLLDRVLRIELYGSLTGGATKALKVRVYMNGTVVVSNTTAVTMASASTMYFHCKILIANRDSASDQASSLLFQAATDAAAPTVNHIIAYSTGTINTALDNPIDISFDFDTAAGAASIENISMYLE